MRHITKVKCFLCGKEILQERAWIDKETLVTYCSTSCMLKDTSHDKEISNCSVSNKELGISGKEDALTKLQEDKK